MRGLIELKNGQMVCETGDEPQGEAMGRRQGDEEDC